MACPCCNTTAVRILVNNEDISGRVNSISVDTAPDIQREPKSNDCIPLPNEWLYLYGPGKTTIQITAYPFVPPEDYTCGLICDVNLSLNVPWKLIYDCRLDSDCLLADGGLGKKKGRWVMIPLKKKQVTVTGDLEGNSKFIVDGCGVSAPKFNIQANQFAAYKAQVTTQYNHLKYTGGPINFDTDEIDTTFKLSVTAQAGCGGFSNVDAYLTGFTLSYNSPQAPTITYSMETPFSICPGTC
jgi:hypothetical protein